MRSNRKVLVLDIDNTLIHTVLFEESTAQQAERYRAQLLELFPGSCGLKGEDRAVIVPRPNLHCFTEFLFGVRDRIDLGVYSTATPEYLQTVLSQSLGWIIGNASFIWGLNKCNQTHGLPSKNLDGVVNQLGYTLSNIRMLDDNDIVFPNENRIAIKPFDVTNFKEAQSDAELIRVISPIKAFIEGN